MLFNEAGIAALRKKSIQLTELLEFLLWQSQRMEKTLLLSPPANPDERGCPLSLLMKRDGKKVFHKLTQSGVIADWREPDVIRIAQVPLYNSFEVGEFFKKDLS